MQISGRSAALLGRDQKAVDQVRLEVRLGGAGDDHDLIDVGDQHVLPAAARAAEHAVPRLDSLDEAFVASGRENRPSRRPRPRAADRSRASSSSRRVAQRMIVPSSASTSLARPYTRKHAASPADGQIDIGKNRKRGLVIVALVADDHALAGSLVLADPLAVSMIVVAPGLEFAREVRPRLLTGAVLRNSARNFFFFDMCSIGKCPIPPFYRRRETVRAKFPNRTLESTHALQE